MRPGVDRLVDSDYVGEGWTPVEPGADPVLYGHAQISPRGRFEVRSYQTFTLTYTVGRFGLDDTGAIPCGVPGNGRYRQTPNV